MYFSSIIKTSLKAISWFNVFHFWRFSCLFWLLMTKNKNIWGGKFFKISTTFILKIFWQLLKSRKFFEKRILWINYSKVETNPEESLKDLTLAWKDDDKFRTKINPNLLFNNLILLKRQPRKTKIYIFCCLEFESFLWNNVLAGNSNSILLRNAKNETIFIQVNPVLHENRLC